MIFYLLFIFWNFYIWIFPTVLWWLCVRSLIDSFYYHNCFYLQRKQWRREASSQWGYQRNINSPEEVRRWTTSWCCRWRIRWVSTYFKKYSVIIMDWLYSRLDCYCGFFSTSSSDRIHRVKKNRVENDNRNLCSFIYPIRKSRVGRFKKIKTGNF